jgi:threonyl-tRNA synthetase
VTDDQAEYAAQVERRLGAAGVRVEADLRNEKLGYKVREAQLEKVPFMLVIGDKEMEEGGVNVRLRGGENLGLKSVEEAIGLIRDDAAEPFKRGGMSYSFEACPNEPAD